MKKSVHFITVLFGPIGDALMALAVCDDILRLQPDATFVILTRRNARLIADLACAYPMIRVRQIPAGLGALPFFLLLLTRRWTLLTLGVTGEYSLKVKLFFFALSAIPGNVTVGFNDQLPGVRKWLPLQHIIQFDGRKYTIDNFRTLLPYVFDEPRIKPLFSTPPYLILNTTLPRQFSLQKGAYIATNVFSASARRSWPLHRWKALFAKVASEWPQYPLVLMGGPSDAAAIAELQKAVSNSIALPGLPLLEAAGVIDNAALYIGVDTGITHLAGVLQQKSLVVSHYSEPSWLPTYNPNARGIANSKRCECKKGGTCAIEEDGIVRLRCMYDLSDDFVLESIRLGLSSDERHMPLFVGFVDEQSGKTDGKDNG